VKTEENSLQKEPIRKERRSKDKRLRRETDTMRDSHKSIRGRRMKEESEREGRRAISLRKEKKGTPM